MSSSEVISPNGLTISIDVENTGDRGGKETVILYLNDECASISRPVREVKGFKKIFLKSKGKMTVTFDLSYADFYFINQNSKKVVEQGYFSVYINNYVGSGRFYLKVV